MEISAGGMIREGADAAGISTVEKQECVPAIGARGGEPDRRNRLIEPIEEVMEFRLEPYGKPAAWGTVSYGWNISSYRFQSSRMLNDRTEAPSAVLRSGAANLCVMLPVLPGSCFSTSL
jgi:hypothetical protein